MTTDEPVYIAGAFEHPTREAPDRSTMQLHAEVTRGALDDAGLDLADVDGYATAAMPEYEDTHDEPLFMTDYLGLNGLSYTDTTDDGGSAQVTHVAHAVSAIRDGRCDVALITLAGRPRSRERPTGTGAWEVTKMQDSFERIYGTTVVSRYALSARRHQHEFGLTAQQLGEVRAAASTHASHNENALYREEVTPEEVATSPTIASPLNLLDCCVITDGGGALIVVSERVQEGLDRECVEVLGCSEGVQHHDGGRIDLVGTPARQSGRAAFAEASLDPRDVDYASLYDSFTIAVITALEDLGFCAKGEGGQFVEGGTLRAPDGELPFNTDGGGLCSNHPGNRGGITKVIEAVRQLRGEANDPLQVPDTSVALAHGLGGDPGTRQKATTLLLGGEKR